jgi:hypothetical protein
MQQAQIFRRFAGRALTTKQNRRFHPQWSRSKKVTAIRRVACRGVQRLDAAFIEHMQWMAIRT